MKSVLSVKDIGDLTATEFKQCKSLNLRDQGNLMYDLPLWKNHPPHYRKPAKVIMVHDEDGRLLAWGLLAPDKPRSRYTAQFYTRKTHRGKGFGTLMMREALKIDKKPFVYPHDQLSGGLFKKYKNSIRYDKYDYSLTLTKEWLK